MNNQSIALQEVTDGDIAWASGILNLPENAFYGLDGQDPRQAVLKSMDTIDVSACPGSGKTTLLVAKLAILARKWQFRTRGICVLSHTNAARHEIEKKLGNTSEGRDLLSYPHYIGTIHGFVNQFLALPWLKSQAYPVVCVDTALCEARRWRKIPIKSQMALEQKKCGPSNMRITDTAFNVSKKNGEFPTFKHGGTEHYEAVKRACHDAAKDGYHCYDDMFLWADECVKRYPSIACIIRYRFPFLFIDEAQDNSEEQSSILHRIFIESDAPVIRQRFGDPNQAIYGFAGGSGAKTDIFPNNKKIDLPNSHRFGQSIADLADPFGLVPYGLQGHGPKKELKSKRKAAHTIFLFDKDNADKVLPSYGDLILNTFSVEEIENGIFTAVGQVHKPKDEEEKPKHFPKHVGHYWPCYDYKLTRSDSTPTSFVQYFQAGLAKASEAGETYPAVEKIAEGFLRFMSMLDDEFAAGTRRYKHRYLLELLEENPDIQKCYQRFSSTLACDLATIGKDDWNKGLKSIVEKIAFTMTGKTELSHEASEFLAWQDIKGGSLIVEPSQRNVGNILRIPSGDKSLNIKVGSIHSIKGQTHTTTLVLETFWYGHNVDSVKSCLLSSPGNCTGERNKTRLKSHYVAMTRPTHLLCLAMKKTSFTEKDVADMQNRGWEIKDLTKAKVYP